MERGAKVPKEKKKKYNHCVSKAQQIMAFHFTFEANKFVWM